MFIPSNDPPNPERQDKDTNPSTLPPDPKIAEMAKPGVDALWCQDAREILVAMIKSGHTAAATPVAAIVPVAAAAADALAAERRARGGVRREDFASQLLEVKDHMPMILDGITQFVMAMRKLDR